MSCEQLKLTNVQNHIGYDNLANILEINLKMYYDWALLCIGGWSEVTEPSVGAYGGDYSTLSPVVDPNYTDGRVWQAPRKDFVWETNVNYTNTTGGISNPQIVSTPKIGGVATAQSYYVNYPQGQIIFDSAIPTGSDVSLDYSYRYVQIYRADDAPWWRELQFKTHRVDDTQFTQPNQGEWSLFGQNRVQLPCIIIETIPRGTSEGWSMGTNNREASRDILFHVLAESNSDRNNIMDIINLQSDRKIPLFDSNLVVEAQAWPLDYRGELVNNQGFEEFVSVTGYRWHNCLMRNSTISNVNQIHPNLYTAVIRTTMSIIV